MKIDLRFVELEQELQVQGGYVEMVESHLPGIIEAERRRLYKLYENDPPDERAGLAFLEHDLDQGIPVRLFAAASVMGSWAAYEASISAVSEEIRKALGLTLKISNLRGSFLEQCQHYFQDVLHFDVHREEAVWDQLRDINEVRNAYAHANGRTDQMPAAKRQRLKSVVSRYQGLSLVDGDVLVTSTHQARHFHNFIAAELLRIFEHVRNTIPLPN